MKMKIQLKGQLQALVGQSEMNAEVTEGETLGEVIQKLAQDFPEQARNLVLGAEGDVRSSLFIAVDGVHTRNTKQPADGFELILMPPIAGG